MATRCCWPPDSCDGRCCNRFDSPTCSAISATEILALLQQLNQQLGKTIIMVTHDAHAAAQARTMIHLEKGELLAGQPA